MALYLKTGKKEAGTRVPIQEAVTDLRSLGKYTNICVVVNRGSHEDTVEFARLAGVTRIVLPSYKTSGEGKNNPGISDEDRQLLISTVREILESERVHQ